jgi:hypothetical protein
MEGAGQRSGGITIVARNAPFNSIARQRGKEYEQSQLWLPQIYS